MLFQFITFCLTLNFVFQTVKSEGPCALYKGFCPTWVRLGPWNIIVSFLIVQNFYLVFIYMHVGKKNSCTCILICIWMDLDQHLVFHDVWAAQESVLIAQSNNCDTHPHAKLSSAPGFNQNLIVCCFSSLSHWLQFIAHQEAREEIPNPKVSSNSRARPDPVEAKDPNEAGLQHLKQIHWTSSCFLTFSSDARSKRPNFA